MAHKLSALTISEIYLKIIFYKNIFFFLHTHVQDISQSLYNILTLYSKSKIESKILIQKFQSCNNF